MFDSNGRVGIWKTAFTWWKNYAHPLTGTGLGTFEALGPRITEHLPQKYNWMHSDWLQILFEQGIIGLTLVAALYFTALYKARRNSPLCIAILAYGAFGMANMPLRFPLTALIGAVLIRWAFYDEAQKVSGSWRKRRSNFLD